MARRTAATKPGGSTYAGFNLGYNGYANPSMLAWQQWFNVSNIYSGQHAKIKRFRFAQVVNSATLSYTNQNKFFESLYNFRDPSPQEILLGDINGKMFSFNVMNQFAATQRLNPYLDPGGVGSAKLAGPWMRARLFNMIFEMNGQAKQTGRNLGCITIEGLGLDSPDASPAINFSSGNIFKTVGRSYAFAWENINKFNVSSPSPATVYAFGGLSQGNAQNGQVVCIQPGTVTITSGLETVTGNGTVFSSAWVGKNLWVAGLGNVGLIVDVLSPTQLNLIAAPASSISAAQFQVYDQQSTHIRLYATGDGQSTYLRIQRNQFLPTATDVTTAGLAFTDSDNTEPGDPNTEFTTELAQFQNVPPPVGKFVIEYQTRLIIFGVAGALQTVFYTNIENTVVGNPPECCGPQNQFTLPIGDAAINGGAGLPTGLILWSDRHDMFKITGNLQDNGGNATPQQIGATIQRLPYTLGCGSPYACVVTDLGVIWLTSDREVWLFTDHYAPRNVGRPVQDILSRIEGNSLANARMVRVKRDDMNWVVLAISVDGSPYNNKILILDLDMLASNGAPSFFVFDMATNQPTWYVADVNCESIESCFDQFGVSHLMAGDFDVIRDVTFRDGFFAQIEDHVNSSITLHAIGNEDAHIVKQMDWVRFITNQHPDTLQTDGWSFKVSSIDDDVYTFDNPKDQVLSPGINSVMLGEDAALPRGAVEGTFPGRVISRPLEFSEAKFATRGKKAVIGKRFLITVQFPNKPGADYEWWAMQASFTPSYER